MEGESRRWRWVAVWVVALAIFVGSVIEPTGDIAQPGPLGLVSQATWFHVGGYGVLSLAMVFALDAEGVVSLAVVPAVVIFYGALIETLQLAIPYRTFALGDILANAVGSLVVVVGVWVGASIGLARLE